VTYARITHSLACVITYLFHDLSCIARTVDCRRAIDACSRSLVGHRVIAGKSVFLAVTSQQFSRQQGSERVRTHVKYKLILMQILMLIRICEMHRLWKTVYFAAVSAA